MTGALLVVDGLSVAFAAGRREVRVVEDVSWTLDAGETLAILGESGSGKSVSVQAVMGILPRGQARVCGGSVRLAGQEQDLLELGERERTAIRGERIAMVFQDALSALNPVRSVGRQIAEQFVVRRGLPRAEARARSVELLGRVGIPQPRRRAEDFPHQFSGGMRQRAMIAMAIALEPEVLIADEPTTALDVTVQAQIMTLLAGLQAETGMSLVLISHDLGVVANVADRLVVMYAGRVVEHGPVRDTLRNPAHPYTAGLLAASPRSAHRGRRLPTIPGQPPDPAQRAPGCAFHPRCARAKDTCRESEPALLPVAGGARWSACHFSEEVLGVG